MADYLVLRASSGTVPAQGAVGSADVYRGDHVTEAAAVAAAAVAMKVSPGVFLYAFLSSASTRYASSISVAVG